jgi:hypothetical protein
MRIDRGNSTDKMYFKNPILGTSDLMRGLRSWLIPRSEVKVFVVHKSNTKPIDNKHKLMANVCAFNS